MDNMSLNTAKFKHHDLKFHKVWWKSDKRCGSWSGQTDRQTGRQADSYIPPKLCLRGIYKATGKIFWPVSQRMQINFIFTDNVHISCLSCSVKKSKTATTLFQLAETSVVLINHFPWCPLWSPCLCCYRFLPSLYTNRIPEKNDIDPWLAG